jgi:tetratricopeptide (TPR) repeat protein
MTGDGRSSGLLLSKNIVVTDNKACSINKYHDSRGFLWSSRAPPGTSLMFRSKYMVLVGSSVTLIICAVVFSQGLSMNSLKNGFHMDDVVAIQKNPDVVALGEYDFLSLLRHDFWGQDMFSGDWTHKSFRPVTTLTYRLNWVLWGLDSQSFHGANVFLHAAVSQLLIFTCLTTMHLRTVDAVLVGLLFGLHPVHVESVLYLVGRADILSGLLMIFSIRAYDTTVTLSYTFALLSGLSKEIGFMTFPILLFRDIIFLSQPRNPNVHRFLKTCAIGMIAICFRYWYTDGTELKMSPQDNPIPFEEDHLHRWLSYAIVHGEYGRLLAFPLFLSYDYSLNTIPICRTIFDVRLLEAFSTYLGLLAVCWWGVKQRSGQLLFAAAFFVLSFLPMSNLLFPVGTVVGERLLYIPSIGFAMASVLIMPSRGKIPIILVIVLCYGIRTVYRVDDWKTASNLTLIDGASNPRSAKTQYNLGVQYFTKQMYAEAAEAFRRSIATDDLRRDGVAHWRAGQAELLRGNLEEAERLLVAATSKYGARLMVREEEIFHDAAVALYHNGKNTDATYYLSAALTINRKFPKALNNMGCLLVSLGDTMSGLTLLQDASALKPRNVIYSGNVWIVAGKLGLVEVAQRARLQTLTRQSSFVPAGHCVWEFKPAEGGPTDSAMND